MDNIKRKWLGLFGTLLSLALLLVLVVPMLALVIATGPNEISAGAGHPLFLQAIILSLKTSVISLVFVVVTGTPLSWWLASRNSPITQTVELLASLPIVIPPAVVGVALLQAYGSQGLVGHLLSGVGFQLSFSMWAVVTAQIVISAPFYIAAAVQGFRKVDPDMLLVARTLGATQVGAFFRVAVPVASPALLAGAALSWARAIGEFGATLLFAGNMPGVTQTMPLAIFTALESDVRVASALALVLAAAAVVALVGFKVVPRLWSHKQ